MNFPRKRATIACNFCRHRKRKCDGQKPYCGLCTELGAECEYQQPAVEKIPDQQSNQSELLDRLGDLERQLKEQRDTIATLSKPGHNEIPQASSAKSPDLEQQMPVFNSPFDMVHLPPEHLRLPPEGSHHNSHLVHDFTSPVQYATASQDDTADPPLTIPIGHQTTTGSLFALQPLKRLIGDYPDDFFYSVESEKPLPPSNHADNNDHSLGHENLDLDKQTTDELVAIFWTHIHPGMPVMEQDMFTRIYEAFAVGNTVTDAEAALCFMVFALGRLFSSPRDIEIEKPTTMNGMSYFQGAHNLIVRQWCSSFEIDVSFPLALLYASIYLNYLVRPLHAWKFVHMASTQMQLIVSSAPKSKYTQQQIDCVGRLCWACYILECDGLAEFHLPRSGIEILVDKLSFPGFGPKIDRDGYVFLAVCSIRKLLNRIHHSIYSSAAHGMAPTSPASLFASDPPQPALGLRVDTLDHVCRELARQLNSWYDALPSTISPNLDESVPVDLNEGWLRLRYWSTKHIIYRPWVLFVSNLPDDQEVSSEILNNCHVCTTSCRNYISTAAYMLNQRTQYTWQTLQAVLACAFVLTIAASSSHITQYVLDLPVLLDNIIRCVKQWTAPDTSAESMVWILQTIRQKQRLSMRKI